MPFEHFCCQIMWKGNLVFTVKETVVFSVQPLHEDIYCFVFYSRNYILLPKDQCFPGLFFAILIFTTWYLWAEEAHYTKRFYGVIKTAELSSLPLWKMKWELNQSSSLFVNYFQSNIFLRIILFTVHCTCRYKNIHVFKYFFSDFSLLYVQCTDNINFSYNFSYLKKLKNWENMKKGY